MMISYRGSVISGLLLLLLTTTTTMLQVGVTSLLLILSIFCSSTLAQGIVQSRFYCEILNALLCVYFVYFDLGSSLRCILNRNQPYRYYVEQVTTLYNFINLRTLPYLHYHRRCRRRHRVVFAAVHYILYADAAI